MHAGARWILPMALAGGLIALAPGAHSQNASPVISLLQNAHETRTRVQAALTLGRLHPIGAREALENALDDSAAAVRAAAVESLVILANPVSLAALRSHGNDRDPGVRSGIARAIRTMEAGAPSGERGEESNGASGNLNHARYVLRVGTISNRAGGRDALVDVMRNAIVQECGRNTDMACAVGGVLPPEAEMRVRAGRVRAYAIEGSVNTLRRWTVATTLSVRAEVSLVLMTHPSNNIVGSLSGAATAQDHTPYDDADAFARRLEDRALVAAVHGALGNLQQSLQASR